jgi:hypothetical protein
MNVSVLGDLHSISSLAKLSHNHPVTSNIDVTKLTDPSRTSSTFKPEPFQVETSPPLM